MLKKIAVQSLRPGMFLHELCGSWMEHPFWNTKFLLEDPADIARIFASNIKECWIDTSKGLDVETSETREVAAERNEQVLIDAVLAEPEPAARQELAAEVQRAAKICGKAKTAIVSMFKEARMGKAVDAGEFAPLVEEITNSVMRNPGALVSLARLKTKDDYTYMHSVAVCGLMVALSRQLGLDAEQTRQAGLGGLIHDLGKAAIPLEILNKPGKLTDQEFVRVKSHPVEGHRMLVEGGGAGPVPLDVCLHHHEKVDGSGYPDKLSADDISLYAKMGAVCDVYDAITSNRPYKAGWNPAEALRKMTEWRNGHFDERIFQAFVKSVGIYPVGSLVRLESGLLAVVVETAETSLLTPKVKTFYCMRRKERLIPRIVDLGRPQAGDRITGWESPERWPFPDLEELWQTA